MLGELPYHLSRIPGKGHTLLVEWLADLDNFAKMVKGLEEPLAHGQAAKLRGDDLLRYWKLLTEELDCDVEAIYIHSLEEAESRATPPPNLNELMLSVGNFLRHVAKYAGACTVLEKLLFRLDNTTSTDTNSAFNTTTKYDTDQRAKWLSRTCMRLEVK